jgi:hypothetical protein
MFLDPNLVGIGILFVIVLACGGAAIWLTIRWYHNLKKRPSITVEALAKLDNALEEHDELAPDEVQRIREAIERQKKVE